MKKILLLGGAAAAYWAYKAGSNKVDTIKQTVEALIIKVASVSNFNIIDGGITFNTTLRVTNPTPNPLNLNAQQLVTIRKISFYTNDGQYLGVSYPNITGISIPANGVIMVSDIPTQVKVSNFGTLLNNAIGLFLDPNKLKITTEIDALGRTYTV